MKFFVPYIDNPESAEKLYQSVKSFAKNAYGFNTTERRIFSITYNHGGKRYHDEVGKLGNNNEPILAILESGSYLVCTLNRGVYQDMPMLVGDREIVSVKDFD